MNEQYIKIFEYIPSITAFISIIVAIVNTIIHKTLPYIKTKISIYRYFNVVVNEWLLNYSLLGSCCGIVISILLSAICGKNSSWEIIALKDYLFVSIIPFFLFVVGTAWIINKKRENVKCRYIFNIFGEVVIYIMIWGSTLFSFWGKSSKKYNIMLGMIVPLVLILQVLSNVDREKIKTVKYVVYVEGKKKYKTDYEPIKQNDFYVIKNDNMRTKIPTSKIEKIKIKIEDIIQGSGKNSDEKKR